MANVREISVGTTSPSLLDTIRANGVAVDISSATALTFRMRARGSSTLKVDATAIFQTDGTDGGIQYEWNAADTDTAGEYLGWWRVTFTGGNVQESAEFDIEVVEHSGGARAGMTAIIDKVRALTGAGRNVMRIDGIEYFTDDQLQAELDARHRRDFWQASTLSQPKLGSDGANEYLDYMLPVTGMVESGTAFVLQEATGGTVDTADYTLDADHGFVTFDSDTSGSVYVCTGRQYDVYGAGAAILREWAGKLAVHSFDVSQGEQSFSRSQRIDALHAAALQLETKAWVYQIRMRRNDG